MEKIEFKPFDKVLVRDDSLDRWHVNFFEEYTEGDAYPYVCLSCCWKFCIPYNDDTKHLLGTTDDYEEPYKPNDGDFVTSKEGHPFICKVVKSHLFYDCYAGINVDCELIIHCGLNWAMKEGCRPATKEEKQLLLSKLAEIGKKWNAEKLCIEDVWQPADGDFIIHVDEMLRGLHIYRKKSDNSIDHFGYVGIDFLGRLTFDMFEPWSGTYRLATESEKQLLLDALHKEGKDWDAEKKEIVDYKWIPKEGEHIYALWMSPVELQFFYEGTTFVDSKIMQKGFSKGLVCRTEEEAKNRCKELNDRLTGNN